MNVEIEAEAALFPEKEHIYGIFVAVHHRNIIKNMYCTRYPIKNTVLV
jgi:hypothetical protein